MKKLSLTILITAVVGTLLAIGFEAAAPHIPFSPGAAGPKLVLALYVGIAWACWKLLGDDDK